MLKKLSLFLIVSSFAFSKETLKFETLIGQNKELIIKVKKDDEASNKEKYSVSKELDDKTLKFLKEDKKGILKKNSLTIEKNFNKPSKKKTEKK